MKAREKSRAEEQCAPWLTTMIRLLKGSVVAGVVTIFVIFVCSFGISQSWLPQDYTDGIVMASCVLGALVGGCFAATGKKGQPPIMCMGVGIVLFLLLLTGGLLAYRDVSITGQGVGILLSCCCGGAMAGILTRKKKRKR